MSVLPDIRMDQHICHLRLPVSQLLSSHQCLIIQFLRSLSNSILSVHTPASSCCAIAGLSSARMLLSIWDIEPMTFQWKLCVFKYSVNVSANSRDSDSATCASSFGAIAFSIPIALDISSSPLKVVNAFQMNSLLNGAGITITSIRSNQRPRNRVITRAWQVFSRHFSR